ncbi:TDP-N-acetylfucosamine:lipid II N-acetylfucosaminyltransferase [Methanocorpusculum bavaricum]|uniref:TDP-N-acetylfucosamine:lipid II N-acetylfucosaminyltransferase n=1 Tax=Methanocorpusculum bavaricum TaxID=71518 RepID=UPI00138AE41C|nr:TDP-N-acetylfucosamine:lipid II N-acetylfucosaminyltransferase [Methanocorpusculum bavaricum]
MDFLSKNHDNSEHKHIIITTTNDLHSNTVVYPNTFNKNDIVEIAPLNHLSMGSIINFLHIWQLLRKSDLVICHSLSYYSILSFLINPLLLSKTVWVIWGYDLYDYRTKNTLSYMGKVFFALKKSIVRHIPYVVARTPDFKLLQKWYGSKAEHLIVEPLYSAGEFEIAPLHIRENTTSPLKITLGNSATETNRHMAALDLLSKYKNENLQIYIPLSYGNPEYAKTVVTKAKEIFGDKVVVLDQFMPPEEYNEHLSEMDIGIFNHNRQQALGNIAYLLASGAKIYLNNDSPLWEIYDEMKFHIHSINTIQEMSYNDFSYLDKEELAENSMMAKKIYSEKHGVECWTRVFNLAK